MGPGSPSVTQGERWVSEQRLGSESPGKKRHLERVGKRGLRLGDEAGSPPGGKDTGSHGVPRGAVRRRPGYLSPQNKRPEPAA